MNKLQPITIAEARWSVVVMLAVALASFSGCRICADCEDMAYPTYGGAWQRTSRNAGRVGSVFDPGGAKASQLVPRDTPPKPDELERERQEAGDDGISDPDRRDEEGEGEPKSDEQRDLERKADELRERKLEDIEDDKEEELRKKDLNDINIRLIPGEPMPPVLR